MKRKHFLGALSASVFAVVGGRKLSEKQPETGTRVVAKDGLPQLKNDPRAVSRSTLG